MNHFIHMKHGFEIIIGYILNKFYWLNLNINYLNKYLKK